MNHSFKEKSFFPLIGVHNKLIFIEPFIQAVNGINEAETKANLCRTSRM